ncbi:UBA/TS-N domain protein [Trichostrongylus colubriformis]|uniref:UBA/TS-N domain protein n=1 Tax=Trichostrongylus colubriformis TaxID=6319 RepID=A0AAN8FLZ9_TRICO
MPKKFANENPKVLAARDRKAAAKKEEQEKKQKAAEDAYWADDDKLVNRKLQRKEEEERKRLEALKRKEENRKLAEAEMARLAAISKSSAQPQKVTRQVERLATIDERKEAELRLQKEEEMRAKLAAEKIEENLNQLELGAATARTVEEAIQVLGGDRDEIDKHPEKRMKAAYLMVKVYHGRECITYSLDKLNSLTARDVIKEVTKNEADRSVLSHTGRFLPLDSPMSSHNLRETDILRILQGSGAPKLRQPCDDALLRECDRLFDYLQKEESGYMHMRLMAEVVEPEFLTKIMKQFPELRDDPVACHILHDYYIFKGMVTLPSDEEGMAKLREFHSQHPALLPAINWLLKKHAQKGRGSTQVYFIMIHTSATEYYDDEYSKILFLLVCFRHSGSCAYLAYNRSRFASQLVQLNEFGFTDEAANLSVLESSDGNVEVALDLLIAMREEGI